MRAQEGDRGTGRGRRPPRRRSDRLEGLTTWFLCCLGVALVVGIVVVSAGVYGRAEVQARTEAADRTQVQAVLLEDVSLIATNGLSAPVPASVRWTAPDGVEHFGRADVAGPAQSGSEVTAWVTRNGDLVSRPVSAHAGIIVSVAVALTIALAGSAMLIALACLERRWLRAVRASEWEREWRRVEPLWSGRADFGPRSG